MPEPTLGGNLPISRLDALMTTNLYRQLGPGGDIQLAERVCEMRLYRPAWYVQAPADLGIGQARGDQAGDRALGRGETVPADLRPPPTAAPWAAPDARLPQYRLGPRQVTRRVEPLLRPSMARHWLMPSR